MRLHKLSIRNFRGIRECTCYFTNKSSVACLIGAGDSGKSTILTAIEWAFWPRYALTVGDIDFYNCDTSNPICIEVSFSGYPNELIHESRFALYQRCQPSPERDAADDEDPKDDEPSTLMVRLEVSEILEPQWTVVKSSLEPRVISASDRAKIPVCMIGSRFANDILWGRNSLLQRYAQSKDAVKATAIDAARRLSEMQLGDLDEVTKPIAGAIAPFGVLISEDSLANRFVMSGASMPSQVGLFDGNAPLMYLGEGSRRLFSTGLAYNLASNGSLILIDEIENGLEPHRLCNLIALLKGTVESSGENKSQAIFSTHSPVVLQELKHNELFAVTRGCDGQASVFNMSSPDAGINDEIQRQLRSIPSAFLARRIYVCEGKTELGIMRAIDEHSRMNTGIGLTAEGVAMSDSHGGTQMFTYAKHLKEAGYAPCIFMDSDTPYQQEKNDAIANGIDIFDWEQGNMTELQVFLDIPDAAVMEMLQIAIDDKGLQSINDQLREIDVDFDAISNMVCIPEEMRRKLGTLANNKKWFKNEERGMRLGRVVLSHEGDARPESTLYTTLRKLKEWAFG